MQPKLQLNYNSPTPLWGDYAYSSPSEDVLSDTKESSSSIRGLSKNIQLSGWESYSLPIGNSYFGVSVFGRTDIERLQITENSLTNPPVWSSGFKHGFDWQYGQGGNQSFGDILIDFNHYDVKNYKRGLDIDNAIAFVEYEYNGYIYRREMLTSYPDKVLAIKLTTTNPDGLFFTTRIFDPFISDFLYEKGDGFSRTSSSIVDDDTIVYKGHMSYYDIHFEGQLKVILDGGLLRHNRNVLWVSGSKEATLIFTCGSNYQMIEKVLFENDPKKKLNGLDMPHERLSKIINDATELGYDKIKENHIKDYKNIFDRVKLDLDVNYPSDIETDKLIEKYKKGEDYNKYVELLLFQYGRYLLISSSRKGGYPATLQGTWNAYASAPWANNYTHDINVQMNYWPSCIGNMKETFDAYVDFSKAYMKRASRIADFYIESINPDAKEEDGNNGWILGAAVDLYRVGGIGANSHSGAGICGFTTLLFWDYYDYTRDNDFLKNIAYPYLINASRLLLKTVKNYDGKYLTFKSASPEQTKDGSYYQTVGCAFDQQMLYENYNATLKAAKELGISKNDEPILAEIEKQINNLDPVLIGADGQVKEYREEVHYGDIGEKAHRHISHLVGLYPGTVINKNSPEWIEAAKVTLNLRTDKSTGWATAHRLCAWARTGDKKRTYDLLRALIKNNILPNMWDTHPPFQIDGNFGATAGICEMLCQSQAGYIDIIPSIPLEWGNGSFDGIIARGNFTIGATWKNNKVREIRILSNAGKELKIYIPFAKYCFVNGKKIEIKNNFVLMNTLEGQIFKITF